MKKRVKIEKSNTKIKKILFYSLVFVITLVSVGYSSMQTALNINGTAYFRVGDWIRITSFNLSNTSVNSSENFNSKYSKNELISSINLPKSNSSLTYNFTIENFSEKFGYIKNITKTQYSNSNVDYEITGCNIDDTIDPHQILNCTITFTNITGTNSLASIIEFEFAEMISSDATLASLSVLNYQTQPTFNADVENYSVEVEEENITIIATTSSDKATITGDGLVPVEWGNSTKNVIVTAEDSSQKMYKINVTNVRPTAPVIQIDNSDFVNDNHIVSVATSGTALSDVDYYEYYISNANSTPDDNVIINGTTNNSANINVNGINYVFYRTVSMHGNRSAWSNGVISNIDNHEPYASVLALDSYSGSTATITFNSNSADTESGLDYEEIYYKLSTDDEYTKLEQASITGQSGKTYNYYLIAYDLAGNHATTNVQEVTLKTYGKNSVCGYTYSDYTSTVTNDVSTCEEEGQENVGLTYTTCTLGNWSSTTVTNDVETCESTPKTNDGLTARECVLDSNWTVESTINTNSCTKSETDTLKVECPTNSWSKSTKQVNDCTASGSTSSNTYYVSCSENGWGSPSTTYSTSCTNSETNTKKVVCGSKTYMKVGCPVSGKTVYRYAVTCTTACGNYTSCTGRNYYGISTYTRSAKYTQTTGTRSAKYKKTTSVKKYTQYDYARLYNQTIYTRTSEEDTCWY